MAGIVSGSEFAKDLSQGGQEEISSFQTIAEKYRGLLSQDLNNLNGCYKNSSFFNTDSDQARRDYLQDIALYLSGKGGAYIANKDDIEQHNQQVKDKYNKLQKSRQTIYDVHDQDKFKKISLQAMQHIYQLKETVTGVTEKFLLTYRGIKRSKSVAYTMEVPMDYFFENLGPYLEMANDVTMGTHSDSINDPWSIRFSNTISDQLRKIAEENDPNINIHDFDIKSYNALKKMKSYRKEVNLKAATKSERRKIKEGQYSEIIYRDGGKYFVVTKDFQTGFLSQALEAMTYSDEPRTFKYGLDSVSWVAGYDITKKDQNGQIITGYSMKSFLEGMPTLLRIDSLHSTLTNIINILSNGTSPEKQKTKLMENIFSTATQFADEINMDIDEFLANPLTIF